LLWFSTQPLELFGESRTEEIAYFTKYRDVRRTNGSMLSLIADSLPEIRWNSVDFRGIRAKCKNVKVAQ